MCPGIESGEPGDCPKCGMPLERTERKIAFITGANRGLGLETARGLGKLGITVLLGSRDQSRGEKAAAELRADGVACVEPVVFACKTEMIIERLPR